MSEPMLPVRTPEECEEVTIAPPQGEPTDGLEGQQARYASPSPPAPPAQHRHVQHTPIPQYKVREPSQCCMFAFLSCCLLPQNPVLGHARRLWCFPSAVVTPYFWGGWILVFVNVATVGGFIAFTDAHDHWWLVGVLAVLFVATIFLLCRAQCADPGVVPRGMVHPDFPSGPNLVGSHVGTTVNGMMIDEKDYVGLIDADRLVVWRWCRTCNIHRPPRSAHCSTCDWCVREFDHHCPVVGSCVAERTFRYFTWVLLFMSAQSAVVFISSLYFLFTHDWDGTKESGLPVMEVIAMFASAVVTCLTGSWSFSMGVSYLGFACKDRTLREQVRGMVNDSGKGAGKAGRGSSGCTNCSNRLLGPEAPSFL